MYLEGVQTHEPLSPQQRSRRSRRSRRPAIRPLLVRGRDRRSLRDLRQARQRSARQDAALYATRLDKGQSVSHDLKKGRHAWVQVARGKVALNGLALGEGDGAAVSEEAALKLVGEDGAEVLVFDLA